jgi:hypothetical protein
MKQLINEARRMQQLAGILKENVDVYDRSRAIKPGPHVAQDREELVDQGIRLGGSVEVIDNNSIYENYSDLFRQLGFKNKEVNDQVEVGDIGNVFDIIDHPSQPDILLAIETKDGRQALISSNGVSSI